MGGQASKRAYPAAKEAASKSGALPKATAAPAVRTVPSPKPGPSRADADAERLAKMMSSIEARRAPLPGPRCRLMHRPPADHKGAGGRGFCGPRCPRSLRPVWPSAIAHALQPASDRGCRPMPQRGGGAVRHHPPPCAPASEPSPHYRRLDRGTGRRRRARSPPGRRVRLAAPLPAPLTPCTAPRQIETVHRLWVRGRRPSRRPPTHSSPPHPAPQAANPDKWSCSRIAERMAVPSETVERLLNFSRLPADKPPRGFAS